MAELVNLAAGSHDQHRTTRIAPLRTKRGQPPVAMTKTPQHLTYMNALQSIADQSQRELATLALMPHFAEREQIAEAIKTVLFRTLPKRFSIGGGVLTSSCGDVSSQTDIVIFDNLNNSPLFLEFGSGVYPVECVYATIEVKSVLTMGELRTSLAAIRKVRSLAQTRHYAVPGIVMKNGVPVLEPVKATLSVAPQSYIVAFSQRGLGETYQGFCLSLQGCLDEHDDHVHGVCVLEENWFAGRVKDRKPAESFGNDKHALLSLYSAIIKGQQNYAVYPTDLDAYLTNPG